MDASAFNISLKILKFYSVFTPKITKAVIKRAIFFQSFIVLHFLLASIYRAIIVKNFDDFIVAIVYVIFSVILTFKLMTFMINQCEIIKMVKELEHLDLKMDIKVVKMENKSISALMMKLLISDLTIGFSLSLSILLLSREKIFTIPMFYYPTNAVFYYLLFGLHYFQIIGIGSISHGEIEFSY